MLIVVRMAAIVILTRDVVATVLAHRSMQIAARMEVTVLQDMGVPALENVIRLWEEEEVARLEALGQVVRQHLQRHLLS